MTTSPLLQVRLSGTGGQGLILAGRMLAEACMTGGRYVAQSQSYEPTSRGGVSRSDLVVSDGETDYPLITHLDALVIMDQSAVKISEAFIDTSTVIVADADLVPEPPVGDFCLTRLPFTSEARRLRNIRVANVISLGTLATLTDICTFEELEEAVGHLTPSKFRDKNLHALHTGRTLAKMQTT